MKIKFRERIKTLRIDANLTQLEVANALGTTQRKVSYWEMGKVEPDIENLWKLAEFYGVTIDYLIGKNEY